MDAVVGHVARERQRHCDRILVGLKDIRRRLDLVDGNRKALGEILHRGRDGFPAAEIARHAGEADHVVRNRDLALLQLADLVDQEQRRTVKTRRRAARQIHLIGNFDAAETAVRRFQQPALAGRQWRAAAERDPDDVALGRPDERLCFRHQMRLVVDEPRARHGLHRSHGAAAAIFGECIGAERDVAAGHRDPYLVEHGILQRGVAFSGEIGFKGRGTGPGRDSPKDDKRYHARPPFVAPPERSVHSASCGV